MKTKQDSLSLITLCVSVFVSALPLHALDLSSALREMIETNPQIKQKRQELAAVNHELEIARSGFLPKIDLRSSVAKEKANTQMTGFVNRDFNTLNTNITLKQNLFSGFMNTSEMEAKRHKIQMKTYELEEKINELSLQLIKSYLDLLKAEELLEVERDNVKAHEDMYRKITLKLDSGSGRMADYKEVQSKLALSYVNTLTQDNNYNDAAAILRNVIGYYVDIKGAVKPSIDPSLLPASLEEALSEAIRNNPAVLMSHFEIESAKSSVDVERSNYYPKIDAELNARAYDNVNGTGNVDKTAAAMVTLSYNLYNGGSDEARVKRSMSDTYNAIERRRSVERDVAEKMAKAYTAYTVFNRQKPFLDVYREASYEKTNYYRDEYDLGRRSLIDLLESEDEHNGARRKAIENEYDMRYTFFRILGMKNGIIPYFRLELDRSGNVQDKGDTLRENDLRYAPGVGEYPLISPQRKTQEKVPEKPFQPSVTSTLTPLTPIQEYTQCLKAARQGDKEAQRRMVHLYEKGIGTAQNLEKALYWKKRSLQKEGIHDKGKGELFSPSEERSKSLQERLQELGIILNKPKVTR